MKSKISFHLCWASVLVGLLVGCKIKTPEHVIPESTMENLLYDYHLAKSMSENLPYEENYKKSLYMDAVFKKYGTTKADFDSSMVWYTRNTEVIAKIYEKVRNRLKGEQDLVSDLIAKRDKKPKTTKAGDSIDVWPWQHVLRLTNATLDNKYVFTLPVDSNYHERDTLIWNARYHFTQPALSDSLRNVFMALQIMYEKDTISQLEMINASCTRQIRLYADTLGSMKEIKGIIFYTASEGHTEVALLVDQLSMMRFHCKDSLSFEARDSLNREMALRDSLAKIAVRQKDSLSRSTDEEEDERRLSPDELNRRRTGARPAKKPEQIEVERHIQQERRERQMILRKKQQQRRQQRDN